MTFYLWRMMQMYSQKVLCKKTLKQKNYLLLASWRSITKREESGSVSQRYGSADPDPYQNVTDPKHCFLTYVIIVLYLSLQTRWLLQREQPDVVQGLRNQLCSECVGQGGTVQPHPHPTQPGGRSALFTLIRLYKLQVFCESRSGIGFSGSRN